MTHFSSTRMNEFVMIQRETDGTFQVEYGLRDPDSRRFVCADFKCLGDAIAWVDGLDRLVTRNNNAPGNADDLVVRGLAG